MTNQSPSFRFGGLDLAQTARTLVIAELSANHGGSLEKALELVQLAAKTGADAIKIQTYTADTMTIDSDQECFRIKGGLWNGYLLHQLYREAHTPWEWHAAIFAEAKACGISCFSTPFDASSVEFLEQFAPPAYKLASFEVIDIPLIRRIAATGRPVIMSTGMANLAEVHRAVTEFRGHGCRELALLKCVSSYPADPSAFNLATIPHLSQTFGVITGLSDHSMGHTVAVSAVALGARVIEKHFCARRSDGGPDSAFSMEPEEFTAMVTAIRQAEVSIGIPSYGPGASEEGNVQFRRSCFVVCDVRAGEHLTAANVRIIRPGHGLPPGVLEQVLGRRAQRDIARGTPLSWDLIGGW